MTRLILVWCMRLGLVALSVVILSSAIDRTWVDLRWFMITYSDKVAHFLAMFVLTTVSALALPAISPNILFTAMLSVAGIIELAQIAGPRSPDWIDFLCSCAGVVSFAVAFYMPKIQNKLKQR